MINKLKFCLYTFLSNINFSNKKEKYIEKADKYAKKIHISYKKFRKIIAKRKNLDLCEVQKLSQIPPYCTTDELFYFNDFYGINHVLKKYAGYPDNYKFKCAIQHSVNFYDINVDQEFDQNLPAVFTTSEHSKEIAKKYSGNSEIYPTSVHILYAYDYHNQEKFEIEKKRLGKNLLVFPVHSACWVDMKSDTDILIKKILDIKNANGFDSVTICVYWLDVLNGLDKKFNRPDLGFNVVTAGHMMDPEFLPRLKTIIKLSDMAVSNYLGSYLFYSIALDKPFHLFKDESLESKVIHATDDEMYSDKMLDLFFEVPEVQEAYKIFSGVYKELTPEQIAFRDKYCDLKSFRSPEQLREIIQETEKMYNAGDYKKAAGKSEVYI